MSDKTQNLNWVLFGENFIDLRVIELEYPGMQVVEAYEASWPNDYYSQNSLYVLLEFSNLVNLQHPGANQQPLGDDIPNIERRWGKLSHITNILSG